MRKHKLTLKTTIFFLFFHFGSKALMLYVNHKSYFFVRTTILVIPMALKLFSLKAIRRKLLTEKGDALLFWGTTRINMLCLPMLINTFMYYQTMSPAFGYMAIILVLCLFFVYPSIGRCIEETSEEGE